MLRVAMLGHLGSDADLRHSAKGTAIASFSLAVDQVRTNPAGGREESTEWFGVSVAGRQADYAARLRKGQRVLVIGRLQISHFQRRDGAEGIGFDVWVDDVQNVTPRSAAETEDGQSTAGAAVGEVADALADVDELPF